MNQPEGVTNDADPNAITIDAARARILERLSPSNIKEIINASSALGRVLADDVVSSIDVPPFRASAMDGYAVRSSECDQILTLAGQSLAGHPGPDQMPEFTAQRITTGARVPDDADAVVQQENVTRNDTTITIHKAPAPGLHVRNPGTDSAQGSVLLKAFERIGPTERALLATHGTTRVSTIAKLKIAVFSTGDELVEPGHQRRRGQINDANRALLLSMLDESCVELTDLGIAADTEPALEEIFEQASVADVVISSGGVSVGDADYVKQVLEKQGRMDIWKIAMKPGRPLSFGQLQSGSAFFGLPGNPVSAAITCLLFVKPAIDHLLGMKPNHIPALSLPLQGHLTKNPGRVEYQRAKMIRNSDERWAVTTTGVQDSHVLSSLHKADCLIELPVSSTGAADGEQVRVFPFTHFSRGAL